MKPEEYPRETSYKYTNVVTGVLELFERIFWLQNDLPTLFLFLLSKSGREECSSGCNCVLCLVVLGEKL